MNDLMHVMGFINANDSNISAFEGIGVEYPFSITFRPQTWSGLINYVTVESSPE
jgi:hypothetical protein